MWLLSTVTVLVLLFGYHTSTSGAIGTDTDTVTAASSGESDGTTVTGPVADTRWGPVQVRLSIQNGRITAVDVVQYPNENHRDQEINADALPTLVQETLDAQNADIDMVSGATVTSDGYLESLQGALDQAGL